jgi:hypothetical protein
MFKKLNKKGIALLISAVLILSVAVGTTIAFLVDSTEDVTDNFTPAKVICDVTNSGDTWSVKNVENIDAYIRVAVIVNETNGTNLKWNDSFSETIEPVNTTDDSWTFIKVDEDTNFGYYYYNGTVAPGASVPFGKITAANAKIQVLAEAIQSTPNEAVKTAWGVTFNGTAWGS